MCAILGHGVEVGMNTSKWTGHCSYRRAPEKILLGEVSSSLPPGFAKRVNVETFLQGTLLDELPSPFNNPFNDPPHDVTIFPPRDANATFEFVIPVGNSDHLLVTQLVTAGLVLFCFVWVSWGMFVARRAKRMGPTQKQE